MLKNYLLIAIRSFNKDRVNTLTASFGLVTGLACQCLLSVISDMSFLPRSTIV